MAKLESTPYRVFYLINHSENRQVLSKMNWNAIASNSQDSDSSKKITIFSRMKTEGDFDTVEVVATITTDRYDYTYPSDDDYNRRVFKWNDIDEDIVELVNKYYRTRSREYDRAINYADMIESMFDKPENISFTVDYEGRPRLAVRGLPYIRDNKVLDLSITISSLSDSYYDICINDHDPSTKYSSESFTNNDLHEIVAKAKRYDQLRDRVMRVLDDPDYDMRFIESMMVPTRSRW